MDAPMPADFDWVTARAACSAFQMFKALRTDADRVVFLCDAQPDQFSVIADGHQRLVQFALRDTQIQVRGDNIAVSFDASLTLTNTGACRFKVNGVELEAWQVLRMALEELLFSRPVAPGRRG